MVYSIVYAICAIKTVINTLHTLSCLQRGDKVPSEVRDRFTDLIPLLHKVEAIFPQGNVTAELAQQIRASLLTRGALPVSASTIVPNLDQ